MKLSVKFLFLAVALAASITAWLKARSEYFAARDSAESNRTGEYLSFSESDSGLQGIMVTDGLGRVVEATLTGPDSIALIRKHGGTDRIRKLWVNSESGWNIFLEESLPNLESLNLWDVQLGSLGLSLLTTVDYPKLTEMTIASTKENPLPMDSICTIPPESKIQTVVFQCDSIKSLGREIHFPSLQRVIINGADLSKEEIEGMRSFLGKRELIIHRE